MTNLIKKSSLYYLNMVLLITLLVSACGPRIAKHGSFFSDEDLKIIKKTKLNKSEVIEILGQPSTKTTFSDNVWYYITQVQKERAYFDVKNISNTVLKITFGKDQIVQSYKIVSEDYSYRIKISNETTDSELKSSKNLIQEFFSSFTRRLVEDEQRPSQ